MFRGKAFCCTESVRRFHNSLLRASSNWAADRVLQRFPEFTTDTDSTEPIYFTGEMVNVLSALAR